jgi:hypothetical protein
MNPLINIYPIIVAAAGNGDIVTNASTSAKDALAASDELWKGLYNGSGIFGRLASFCIGIAFLFLLYKIYKLYEEYRENFDITKLISTLLVPIIILCLLSRSGSAAKQMTYGLRTLTRDFGVSIIQNVGSDILADKLKKGVPEGIKSDQIIKDFLVDMDKCRTEARSGVLSGPEICATTAASRLNRRIRDAGITDPITIDYANRVNADIDAKLKAVAGTGNGASTDPGSWFQGLPSFDLNSIAEQIVTTILNAVVIAFYWMIELATLLYFYLLPMSLAMGVIDPKAIVDWFTNFWSLCNAKICFAIVLALIGQVSSSLSGISFVIEILGAVFAPVITYMFCKGSAMAMAEGFAAMGAGALAGGAGAGAKSIVGGGGRAASWVGSKLSDRAKSRAAIR